MNLDLTLQENMRQPGFREIIAPLMEQRGVTWHGPQRTLEQLIGAGAVVKPDTDLSQARRLTAKLESDAALTKAEAQYLTSTYKAVVEGIEQLQEGQAYLLPMTKEGLALVPDNYDTSTRFRKWGRLVKLRRFGSVDAAERARITPMQLIRVAFQKARLHESYTGYNFAGIRVGEGSTFNRVLLEDCIDGAMIFSYCTYVGKADETANIIVTQRHQPSSTPRTGGMYVVKVPSVDKEEVQSYRIVLKSVPIREKRTGRTRYSTWFNLNAEHTCVIRQDGAHTGRFVRGSRDLCKHIQAAMLYLGWYLRSSDDPYELSFLVNVVPTQSQYNYAMKLRHSVIAEYEDEKGSIIHGTLTKIQREVLEWKRVALRGFDETFAARKGFQDYILGAPQALGGL
ncbi:hypothetical protein HYV82_01620 [Candidatus Woesearchaeota archaeon]|nr:hypothetical protein [Candidatus Woesearchaeota archaeon]